MQQPQSYSAASTKKNHLNTNLIPSRFGDVPNPSICMITTLIVHSQKPYMHTRGCKHGHLKLHIDRWTNPCLGTNCTDQFQVNCEHALSFAGEAFDSPYNSILFWFVFSTSKGVFDFGFRCVFRNRDFDYYMGSKELFGEVGDYFEIDGTSKMESSRHNII